MTPAEKASETRLKNKQARAQKEEEARQLRDEIWKRSVDLLEMKDTTPDQKLEALKILQGLLKGR